MQKSSAPSVFNGFSLGVYKIHKVKICLPSVVSTIGCFWCFCMQSKKSGLEKLVFPGMVLCTEEEFAPGANTQLDAEGNVVSTAVGMRVFDSKHRTVGVEKRTRNIQPVQPGSIVIGRIVLVKDNAAVVEPLTAQKNDAQMVMPSVTTAVPVSRMDQSFVASAKQKFKVGDIMVGVVEKAVPWGTDLNTASPQFGVLKAFCSRCRSVLQLAGRQLKCTRCGNLEFRKVSSSYWIK